MTENSAVSEEERLDAETEIRIGAFLEDALVEGRLRYEPNRRVGELDQAIDFRHASANALRKRIRTLIEEARKDATRGWMLVGPASTIFPKRESSDD